jgi:O-succinylbenzoate synthase
MGHGMSDEATESTPTIELAQYELPLRRTFRTSRGEVKVRHGILVRASLNGRCGYGEVAPLPGFHKESLAEAVASLREACAAGTTPSARSAAFGLSCAMAELRRDTRFGFGPLPRGSTVGVNAVFSGSAREAERAVKAGEFAGFQTVKVKIGRSRPAEDLRVIHALLGGLPGDVRLRLDANRSLTLANAERLLRRIDASRIEYVEEPLQDSRELSELSRRVGMTMAIDEALHDPEVRDSVYGAPGIEVQVVKPSLVGPVEELESVVTAGRIHGMDTVFSTALETSLTVAIVSRFALAFPCGTRDHGLATPGLFERDIADAPHIRDGRLEVPVEIPVPRADAGLEFVPASAFELREQAAPAA